MWLFSRGGSSSKGAAEQGTVSSFPNAADAQTVLLKQTKGIGHEEGILSPSLIDRTKSQQLAIKKGDGRVSFFDTDAIDCIVKRYTNEMTVADRQMKQKQEKYDKSLLHLYDYEGDRRYKQWLTDQERVHENLKIHWLDMMIDKPFHCLTYLARVGTTIGFFYGLGRSLYLYRTMDKMYAKLHGVSFSNIAIYEISLSVIKWALVSAAGTVGVVAGEAMTNIVVTVATGDISVPDRTWVNIWACGTSCGLFGGGVFAALHASLLTFRGMSAAVAGFTTISSLAGLTLGRRVYHPYASGRQNRIYDPYWRPWYERRLNDGGGSYMRGKYT
ncbi:hypothetical protein DQ04_01051060 [Trypanosoma grayi]|uniref:hypothetical protein n=1 Tax=Trypanosoma grayi TaxID=71804 RepID=UPI0004F4406D|nr:hypothetical protein DQ04_01051060 [Trypanosoma grayi]KEG13353.1 hypothetical protein DQ04_01051060 [Trypanosoma grayi]